MIFIVLIVISNKKLRWLQWKNFRRFRKFKTGNSIAARTSRFEFQIVFQISISSVSFPQNSSLRVILSTAILLFETERTHMTSLTCFCTPTGNIKSKLIVRNIVKYAMHDSYVHSGHSNSSEIEIMKTSHISNSNEQFRSEREMLPLELFSNLVFKATSLHLHYVRGMLTWFANDD